MEGYRIPRLAELVEVDTVVQQVYVGDQVRDVTARSVAVACPSCGRVIYQFPQGVGMAAATRSMAQGRDDLTRIAVYCPGCGTRLCYGGETIDEVADPVPEPTVSDM